MLFLRLAHLGAPLGYEMGLLFNKSKLSMVANIESLADQIRVHREHKKLTQKQLADSLGAEFNRSTIAHLEQARKLPYEPTLLQKICEKLDIPKEIWEPFLREDSIRRGNFEAILKELVGEPISALNLDPTVIDVVEEQIRTLFSNEKPEHAFDIFNSVIIFYGVRPVTKEFFEKYFRTGTFRSLDRFNEAVQAYLKDAIRLFSTFSEAFILLNIDGKLSDLLKPLESNDIKEYTERSNWSNVININENQLPYLGYIAATRVKQEEKERSELAVFLRNMAIEKRENKFDISKISEKTKRKMDSLLRKFNSKIENGLFSPLFHPDPDLLDKEADYISPKEGSDIDKMESTQKVAYRNLANYLTADYMDVYVATSMRSDADFVSVNRFVEALFQNEEVEELKLRYFNPTQSWIEDRVAKGLVEALMLKRANICIYMAQKEDTFGKDSEASVTLGQGKPVIVYVPKLFYESKGIDSEKFGRMERKELIDLIKIEDAAAIKDIDDAADNEALHSKLLQLKLDNTTAQDIEFISRSHWADYDLFGEVEKRVYKNESLLASCKTWLREIIIENRNTAIPEEVRKEMISIFVANTIRFERRAKIFREVHPLALQVILSTGVLNGILVVRSIASCAQLLRALVENKLELNLVIDDDNYRLVESKTNSTIRVISRHKLLANSFTTFYKKYGVGHS